MALSVAEAKTKSSERQQAIIGQLEAYIDSRLSDSWHGAVETPYLIKSAEFITALMSYVNESNIIALVAEYQASGWLVSYKISEQNVTFSFTATS